MCGCSREHMVKSSNAERFTTLALMKRPRRLNRSMTAVPTSVAMVLNVSVITALTCWTRIPQYEHYRRDVFRQVVVNVCSAQELRRKEGDGPNRGCQLQSNNAEQQP